MCLMIPGPENTDFTHRYIFVTHKHTYTASISGSGVLGHIYS